MRQIEDALTAPFRATDDWTNPGTGEWFDLYPDIQVAHDFSAFDPQGLFAFLEVSPNAGNADAYDLGLTAYRGNPTLTIRAFVTERQGKGFALDLLDAAKGLFEGNVITVDGTHLHMRGHSPPSSVSFLSGFSTLSIQLNFIRL